MTMPEMLRDVQAALHLLLDDPTLTPYDLESRVLDLIESAYDQGYDAGLEAQR